MEPIKRKNSPVFAIAALLADAVMVASVYWVTGPGMQSFNEFNEKIFGHYYTAGAIAMIGVYVLAFTVLLGIALAATMVSWIRREFPFWITGAATAATLTAPVISVNLLSGP